MGEVTRGSRSSGPPCVLRGGYQGKQILRTTLCPSWGLPGEADPPDHPVAFVGSLLSAALVCFMGLLEIVVVLDVVVVVLVVVVAVVVAVVVVVVMLLLVVVVVLMLVVVVLVVVEGGGGGVSSDLTGSST
ncbi:unnamed protein product [Arctogadus glacialis]